MLVKTGVPPLPISQLSIQKLQIPPPAPTATTPAFRLMLGAGSQKSSPTSVSRTWSDLPIKFECPVPCCGSCITLLWALLASSSPLCHTRPIMRWHGIALACILPVPGWGSAISRCSVTQSCSCLMLVYQWSSAPAGVLTAVLALPQKV